MWWSLLIMDSRFFVSVLPYMFILLVAMLRALPTVMWVVASQALRMSRYCNQSAFGVALPTFYSIVSGGQNSLSGGKIKEGWVMVEADHLWPVWAKPCLLCAQLCSVSCTTCDVQSMFAVSVLCMINYPQTFLVSISPLLPLSPSNLYGVIVTVNVPISCLLHSFATCCVSV